MRVVLLTILLCFFVTALADVHVHGYTRRNGTYILPHMRSNPDHNSYDNWSTKGNINPYTGEKGAKMPKYEKKPNQYNNYPRIRY